jgi:N,N-dimethylformamidase beta subunit-like, C-terminal
VAGRRPLLAGFGARSYRPGGVAVLRIDSAPVQQLTLRLFLAGGAGAAVMPPGDRDSLTFGQAVTEQRELHRPTGSRSWLVHIRLAPDWPSGDYVAHLSAPGVSDYAPFVLRPRRLGSARVLVVEPTNTWEAYNVTDGDSWYLDPAVHLIDLTRPYAGVTVRGRRVTRGLPDQFSRLDLGFLRWYWHSCFRADFVSDDDLELLKRAATLRHYRLIVFAGHEEYITAHVYDLIERYRDLGGNLAFLSANNFFYRVEVSGNTMRGRTRWRDLGRPEAALVGAEYVGWNESRFPNHPYRILDTRAARWLFAGTGLHYGSRLGHYGIEIDQRSAASPPNTRVLATIRNDFGIGKSAEMTIYRHGRATVFDAGVLNFGGSAHWPQISRLVSNLWTHLSGEPRQEQPTCAISGRSNLG